MYKFLKIGFHILLYFFPFFLIAVGYWINRYFGSPSFEQILYHLQFGSEGILNADKAVIDSFVRWCIFVPLFNSFCAYFIEQFITLIANKNYSKIHNIYNKYILPLIEYVARVLYWTIKKRIIYIALLAIAIPFLFYKISLYDYLKNMKSDKEDYFAINYVDPQFVEIKANTKPKNLILIYVESLENSFADKELFGSDLLTELDVTKIGGQSFPEYKTPPTAAWTAGAIVATQCAIPLRALPLLDKRGINSFASQGNKIKSFLPGAVCLSDILAKNGYNNVFMNGPDTDFAALSSFLRSHEYKEIYGKNEMLRNGMLKEDTDSWGGGVHDAELFELAKKKFIQLEQEGKPFNLTLLTVDTHAPDGTISPNCPINHSMVLANAVECTANSLAKFIKFIEESGYDNTDIVIIGDHLFMASTEIENKHFYKYRNIFNRFITNNPNLKISRKQILHFDLLPTILYSLGFSFEDNRLGLGYSGFDHLSKNFPTNRLQKMNENLLNYSKKYMELWDLNKASGYNTNFHN